MLYWLRRQITLKRQELDALVAKASDQKRDMSGDESAAFDQLVADVKGLQSKVKALEDVEAVEDEEPESRGTRSQLPGHAPAIHSNTKRPYSLMRAIRLAADSQPVDGLEGEVSREVQIRSGRTFKGFALPTSSDPEIRAMMYPHMETRDNALTTVTGAGGIFNVPKGFVEYLRPMLVVASLGATVMTDMQGLFSIPRQSATNTVQWVGEGASITPTNPGYDQIPFSPKLAIASTVITRQYMMQQSIDVENRVHADLAKVLAVEFDRVILAGSGGVQPLGLLNNLLIQQLSAGLAAPGGNGGPLTYASAIALETQVASANAAVGKLAYLLNPTLRGALKQTYIGTAGYPLFVYSRGPEADVGDINAYPARATTLMPNNTTKGTSTNCSSIIFANWADLTIATWDTGVDIIVDPYTGKRSGQIEITLEMAMDSHPDHEQSFALRSDVTPA